MPLFTLTCLDRPGSLQVRMSAREAHLAYVARMAPTVRLGGPFLGPGGEMCGSLLIVETADLASAQAFSAADPYVLAGLFERVEIRPFRVTVGAL
ncbi:YciI family protein [Phenylobacterium sp.]|jgi:hypothetical protein|uniref:YciI family protein n=1 Tax=Phenylobacterium sp. TaxID=1871053 RepID=UPI002F40F6F4